MTVRYAQVHNSPLPCSALFEEMLTLLFAHVALLIDAHIQPFLLLLTSVIAWWDLHSKSLGPSIKTPGAYTPLPETQPIPHLPSSVPHRLEQPKAGPHCNGEDWERGRGHRAGALEEDGLTEH